MIPTVVEFSQSTVLYWSFRPMMIAATSFVGQACRRPCGSLNLFAIIGALLRRFCDAVHVHRHFHNKCFAWQLNFLTNSSCHVLESLDPSLRCLSYSPNASCNAFSDPFNSPDSADLDQPINNVGFSPFHIISHLDCTRSSLRFIVVTSSTQPRAKTWTIPEVVCNHHQKSDDSKELTTTGQILGNS